MTAPHPVDPLAADATLHLLADQLVRDLAADRLPPSLLHLALPDAEGCQIGFLPLEGDHPSDLLIGFTAPPEWYAIGIAAHGWAHHLDRTSGRGRQRVHVVTLLSRSGEHAHRTWLDDEPSALDDTDPPAGEQVDLLRLTLGLTTAPPPCESGTYFAIEWLAALLDTDAGAMTWDDVCRHHPATTLLARHSRHRDEDFADIASSFARVCSWSRLRQLTVSGQFPAPELVASDGAWFDDGAFARYLLNRCPPLSLLRAQVRDHLPGPLADRLDRALRQLGVPETTWPETRGAA